MHRVLDGGHHVDALPTPSPMDYTVQPDDDMGGTDFGVSDGTSWDDTSGGSDDWS
jgi:hypothetical protein